MRKTTKTEMLQVRCSPELLDALDNLRRQEPDVPTRPEMARRLIETAISEQKTTKSKPPKR